MQQSPFQHPQGLPTASGTGCCWVVLTVWADSAARHRWGSPRTRSVRIRGEQRRRPAPEKRAACRNRSGSGRSGARFLEIASSSGSHLRGSSAAGEQREGASSRQHQSTGTQSCTSHHWASESIVHGAHSSDSLSIPSGRGGVLLPCDTHHSYCPLKPTGNFSAAGA